MMKTTSIFIYYSKKLKDSAIGQCVVCSLALIFTLVCVYFAFSLEISKHNYNVLNSIKEDHPVLKNKIKEFKANDGKISKIEYVNIMILKRRLE